MPIPFGTVYSTNLTMDEETGLGARTEQQIADGPVSVISEQLPATITVALLTR